MLFLSFELPFVPLLARTVGGPFGSSLSVCTGIVGPRFILDSRLCSNGVGVVTNGWLLLLPDVGVEGDGIAGTGGMDS